MSSSGGRMGGRGIDLPVVVVLAGVLLAFMLFGGQPLTRDASNVGLAVAAAAAATVSARRALLGSGYRRRAFLLFAAGCGCWALGQLLWLWFETVRDTPLPFPSLADVGYLGLMPFTAGAFLTLQARQQGRTGLLRSLLDGLVIAASLLVVSTALVLWQVYRYADDTLLARELSLVYPLGDVVLLSLVVAIVPESLRTRRLPMATLLLLGLAVFCMTVSDSGFAYLTALGAYHSGHLIDAGWLVGFALVFLASRRGLPAEEAPDAGPHLPRFPVAAAPFLLVLLAVGIGGAAGFRMRIVFVEMVATLVLLALRQAVTISENVALARSLEDRVRARTAELARSEERFRSLVQNSSDVVTIIDRDGRICYQSPAVDRVFGYSPGSLLTLWFVDIVAPQDRDLLAELIAAAARGASVPHTLEFRLRRGDGVWGDVAATISNLLDEPAVQGLVLNVRDVTERKRLEQELTRRAFHDALTGLPNRALFRDRLERALGHRRPPRRPLAVLFCDLDGFKEINDSLGHSAGDRLLVEVAQRLARCLREGDTVARLGGDESALLLEEISGDTEAHAVAERVGVSLREPFGIAGREVYVNASVGIAVSDDNTGTADSLLRNTDTAMYQAKALGLGGFQRYRPSGHRTVDRLGMDASLRHALDRGELLLHYQPIMALAAGEIVGLEALIRWRHPGQGALPPSEFVAVAERSALIVDLGRWVLTEACRQMADGRAGGQLPPGCYVSVNLSARQVHSPLIKSQVDEALARSGLPTERLLLELTETVLFDNTEETLSTLQALKARGVRLALDDFGTGYSSLSYLQRFPVDVLKIDRSFTDLIDRPQHARGMVPPILDLGHALGLSTIAEGVERPTQLTALRQMGCPAGQGFLLCPPRTAEAVGTAVGAASRLNRRPVAAVTAGAR